MSCLQGGISIHQKSSKPNSSLYLDSYDQWASSLFICRLSIPKLKLHIYYHQDDDDDDDDDAADDTDTDHDADHHGDDANDDEDDDDDGRDSDGDDNFSGPSAWPWRSSNVLIQNRYKT